MFIIGDAAVEMTQRNKTQWRRPNKQKASFTDHGSKQNRCLQKEYKKPEAMEKVYALKKLEKNHQPTVRH